MDDDLRAILKELVISLRALDQRLCKLEKQRTNDDLATEMIDLPRHLMPRRGYETGWPLGSKIHYTQPLLTKTKQR
jgi:hypothetical protein